MSEGNVASGDCQPNESSMTWLPIPRTLTALIKAEHALTSALFTWSDDLQLRGDRPGWEGYSYKVSGGHEGSLV